MNAARKKGSSTTVTLPWERRTGVFAGLFSRRRWGALLAAGCVGGLAVTAWNVADERARVRSTRAGIAEVQRAVSAFRAELGRCPHSTIELVHPPRAGAQYLSELPNDGWGNELWVRCPGRSDANSADVVSAGASGSFLEDDNIL